MVDDALSRFSMGITTHLEEEKKELEKHVHRLACLGVHTMDFQRRRNSSDKWIESLLGS